MFLLGAGHAETEGGDSAAGIGENRLLNTLANPLSSVYAPPVGACRPTWRRAFVRFTKNKVVRNSFLSNILQGFGKANGEATADFS